MDDVIQDIKSLAGRIMYQHYTLNDVEAVIQYFAQPFSWFGTGEEQYCRNYQETIEFFRRFQDAIPKCSISEEEYDVAEIGGGLYLCTGRFWVETDASLEIYAREHQRVSMLFCRKEEGYRCIHIHCSNPYGALEENEVFPNKAGQYSYAYAKEKIKLLEAEMQQKNKQMEVVMKSINGGMKISLDDEVYTFAYVSEEAAGLFGYTVKEFLEVTGGNAVNATYPPDTAEALRSCEECFRNGNPEYAAKYRVRCKDGTLKWILDSGKKTIDENGVCTINSLYLDITDSENKAQEIRKQKELLDSIYDTVPSGILRFVRQEDTYRIVSINRAVLSIFDYDSKEECFRDWDFGVLSSVHEEDRIKIRDLYQKLSKTGDFIEHQYRVWHRDGSLRWVEAVTSVVGIEEGNLIFQRLATDVTEKRQLQEQIRREQEMYRVAMESSQNKLYEYSYKDDELIVYSPVRDNTGDESVVKKRYLNFLGGGLAAEMIASDGQRKLQEQIHREKEIDLEVCLADPARADQYLWHRITGKVIAEKGMPDRLVGTLQNIHQMKQELSMNQKALKLNRMAMEAIRNVYLNIFCVNLQTNRYDSMRVQEEDAGNGLQQNGAYNEQLVDYILKRTEKEEQKKLKEFLNIDELGRKLQGMDDHIEIEVRQNHDKSDKQGWIRIEGYLASHKDGRPENIVLTFLNISDEKQRELEYLAEERKAKAALEEAYVAAKRGSDAKSDFLSKMSHDIRTPINAIMGMTAIAEKQIEDTKKVRRCLEQVQESSGHLLRLVNEVLDMAKIESRTISLKNSEFSIRDLINSLTEMIRPDLEKKRHSLKISEGSIVHEWVEGDFQQLQQVFLNLLANAVKYTPVHGQIRFGVEERLTVDSGVSCYEFTVEDNGIGMSREFLNRIFEPFERADDERVRKEQGTGLGMSITSNLIRMMGGAIRIESKPEQGTKISVTLYLTVKSGAAKKIEEKEPVSFQGERILLAEDNDVNREIAKELLNMAGLECEEAVDGGEAVAMFERSKPGYYRMILMDIQMPVLDGYEASRQIRAMQRKDASGIPIIALTANAFADDVYQSALAGMNEHISKPFDLCRITQVIQKWLYPK